MNDTNPNHHVLFGTTARRVHCWTPSIEPRISSAKLVRDKTLQYGMPFSPTFEPYDGNRRTTIQITDAGEWHEILEVWQSGKWYKVEESTLKKIK